MHACLNCLVNNIELLSYSLKEQMALPKKLTAAKRYHSACCQPTVTNEMVLELLGAMNRNTDYTYSTLREWLLEQFGAPYSKENFPSVSAIRQSVLRVSAKLCKLRKEQNSQSKFERIQAFLQDEFHLPQICNRITEAAKASQAEDKSRYIHCDKVLQDVNVELCRNLTQSQLDNEVKEEKLMQLRHKMYSMHRNTSKKFMRKENTIALQASKISEQVKTLKCLNDEVSSLKPHVEELQRDKEKLRHKVAYWKQMVSDLKEAYEHQADENTAEQQLQSSKLTEKLYQLEQENTELKETVDDILEHSPDLQVTTFQSGRYTDNIRACCYELLSLNVGIKRVAPIITAVLKNLTDLSVDRLPSKSLLCNMMVECLTLAHAQLGEELSHDDKSNYTIQSDGTTKFGEHYGTFDIATDETTYILGIRHVFSGSAQDTLDTLKEILEDLDLVQAKLQSANVSSKIIIKLKNSMSDRHAAEKHFNQLLSEYRSDILPDVFTGWSSLEQKEKEQIIRMNNFFCGLHFLVALADAAEATIKLWESIDSDGKASTTSGTQRLIRTACKAFTHRGSEQAGCSAYFRSYLWDKEIHRVPLAPFRGNRFNIIFYDAAGVYYLKQHMEDYLKYSHGQLNKLLQAVLSDLRVPTFIAGCKALGIIDKVVTGPLWRHLVHSSVSVLEMSDTYSRMHTLFKRWGEDAQGVLNGEQGLFDDDRGGDDVVADKLFQSTMSDLIVQELLQLLFKSFTLTAERLLPDHLPGGVYNSTTDRTLIETTKSVPTTNVAPERDFAVLDQLKSQKPNATSIALESVILYSHNKTSDWLKGKSKAQQKQLFDAAISLTAAHKAKFYERRKQIEVQRLETVKRRQEEIVRKKAKEIKQKEELSKKLQKFGGLWTTEVEVRDGLKKLKGVKAKQTALKVQISFRKKVLSQEHPDKIIFQFSHKRQTFSVSQLKENLLKLLSPHEELHVSSLTKDEIYNNPELLVYKRIEHLFSCDGEMIWFTGTVVSYNEEAGEFSIAYDDEDDICQYPLLEDMAKGELRLK